MIFSDEKRIYINELEVLSVELENKSRDEILDILDGYNKILVGDPDLNYSEFQRIIKLFCYTLVPFLLILGLIKWVATGDQYLDSWVKVVGLSKWFKKYIC